MNVIVIPENIRIRHAQLRAQESSARSLSSTKPAKSRKHTGLEDTHSAADGKKSEDSKKDASRVPRCVSFRCDDARQRLKFVERSRGLTDGKTVGRQTLHRTSPERLRRAGVHRTVRLQNHACEPRGERGNAAIVRGLPSEDQLAARISRLRWLAKQLEPKTQYRPGGSIRQSDRESATRKDAEDAESSSFPRSNLAQASSTPVSSNDFAGVSERETCDPLTWSSQPTSLRRPESHRSSPSGTWSEAATLARFDSSPVRHDLRGTNDPNGDGSMDKSGAIFNGFSSPRFDSARATPGSTPAKIVDSSTFSSTSSFSPSNITISCAPGNLTSYSGTGKRFSSCLEFTSADRKVVSSEVKDGDLHDGNTHGGNTDVGVAGTGTSLASRSSLSLTALEDCNVRVRTPRIASRVSASRVSASRVSASCVAAVSESTATTSSIVAVFADEGRSTVWSAETPEAASGFPSTGSGHQSSPLLLSSAWHLSPRFDLHAGSYAHSHIDSHGDSHGDLDINTHFTSRISSPYLPGHITMSPQLRSSPFPGCTFFLTPHSRPSALTPAGVATFATVSPTYNYTLSYSHAGTNSSAQSPIYLEVSPPLNDLSPAFGSMPLTYTASATSRESRRLPQLCTPGSPPLRHPEIPHAYATTLTSSSLDSFPSMSPTAQEGDSPSHSSAHSLPSESATERAETPLATTEADDASMSTFVREFGEKLSLLRISQEALLNDSGSLQSSPKGT